MALLLGKCATLSLSLSLSHTHTHTHTYTPTHPPTHPPSHTQVAGQAAVGLGKFALWASVEGFKAASAGATTAFAEYEKWSQIELQKKIKKGTKTLTRGGDANGGGGGIPTSPLKPADPSDERPKTELFETASLLQESGTMTLRLDAIVEARYLNPKP